MHVYACGETVNTTIVFPLKEFLGILKKTLPNLVSGVGMGHLLQQGHSEILIKTTKDRQVYLKQMR